jgi:diketogulonate reductase-like aldo/keto reductase
VERYLKELGIEYLDLVLLHWPKRGAPMAESLLKIQEMDYVKSVGVSNFSIDLIEKVMSEGFKPVTNQVELHPYLYQDELLAFCHENNIVLTAYSPLARGKVTRDPVLTKIGKKHDASAVQISLAWIMSKNAVVIPKASSWDHLKDNFDAMNIELSEDEIAEIDMLNKT